MAGNDAEGKAPTFAEQTAKFQGFSTKDGEVADGKGESQADLRAEAEAAEQRAGEVNKRPHAENVKAGNTSTDKPAAAAKGVEITLTDDEEETALQALVTAGADPDKLTQEQMQAAIDKALADKKAAAKPVGTRKERRAERFNDNARTAREATRRADALQQQIDDLRAGKTPLTKDKGAGNAGDELVKPDHADTAKYQYGELDAKYIADLARYETLKALADGQKSQGTAEQKRRDADAAAEFKERVDAFTESGRDEFDDFDEVVTDTLNLPKDDPAAWPLSATMGELLLESDHGRAIAYELATDPKEAKRIFKLSEARQAIWFGQREAALSSAKADAKSPAAKEPAAKAGEKTAAQESKAPVPLRTKLHGSGGNRVPNSATTDFAAFEAQARSKR